MVKYGPPKQLDLIFAALSDPTRRAILQQLTQQECSVSELAEPHDISLVAVSKHLKVLERAGLVQRSRQGRVHRLSLQARPLESATQWLETYRVFWEGALGLLGEYLEGESAVVLSESEQQKPRNPKEKRL